MSQNSSIAGSLPTEIYFKIFKLLRVPELIKCRIVCTRWREIIDEVTNNQEFWNQCCLSDFKETYEAARRKSKVMPIQHFYRSLHLWSKLSCAEEDRDEFCFASSVREEIQGFKLLRNDVIGVHKRSAIYYYNVQTLKPLRRNPVFGAYDKYAENDDVILTQDSRLNIYIVHKQDNDRQPMIFEDVKTFILLAQMFYYADVSDNVYSWTISDRLPKKFLGHCKEGIISLGYSHKKLHVLTCERTIYTVLDDELKLTVNNNTSTSLIDVLYRHNMLDAIDWQLLLQWIFMLNRTMPEGLLQDIITVRAYGDIVFIGTTWGVLRIYYRPFIAGKFDIFNSKPIKQYNFMETCDCPVLSMCQIISIDCREDEDGHTVFVAMPKKIAVLKYRHIFKPVSQGAVPQLTEMQPMRIMNVN